MSCHFQTQQSSLSVFRVLKVPLGKLLCLEIGTAKPCIELQGIFTIFFYLGVMAEETILVTVIILELNTCKRKEVGHRG